MTRESLRSCLGMQLRVVSRRIPAQLAMALAALLLSAAVAAAGRLYVSGRNFSGITLAIEVADADERMDTLLDVMAGLPDIQSFATLQKTPPGGAEAMVRSGEATAAILLPAGFLDSILSGENLSPTLLLDSSRPLEMMLVANLAQSATRMVASAQQGVGYTMSTYDAAPSPSLSRADVTRGINISYVAWVLQKNGMFRAAEVSATGVLSVSQHYLISAGLFFAILSTPVLYGVFSLSDQSGWLRRLRAAGCPLPQYVLAQLAAGTLAIFIMLCALFAGIGVAGWDAYAFLSPAAAAARLLPGLLLTSLCLTGFAFLCCNIGGIFTAASLPFLLATAAMLPTGGLVPTVLLPAPLAALAPCSPFGWLRDILSPAFGGVPGGRSYALSAALTALLLACCFLRAHRIGRRLPA